ncbi:hypothetical protein B0H63DRAFT_35184 [Podospora didyma]|uniref:Uncharacterized protein n=1 Tax=Podospora didyma TaxID=330526 RepID=A0AAE0P6C4_9PEZI|nr:hypothetical protein B0H63DRAFT_35184 [Podospora didyma]
MDDGVGIWALFPWLGTYVLGLFDGLFFFFSFFPFFLFSFFSFFLFSFFSFFLLFSFSLFLFLFFLESFYLLCTRAASCPSFGFSFGVLWGGGCLRGRLGGERDKGYMCVIRIYGSWKINGRRIT